MKLIENISKFLRGVNYFNLKQEKKEEGGMPPSYSQFGVRNVYILEQ